MSVLKIIVYFVELERVEDTLKKSFGSQAFLSFVAF
jgi:hypothetical protein